MKNKLLLLEEIFIIFDTLFNRIDDIKYEGILLDQLSKKSSPKTNQYDDLLSFPSPKGSKSSLGSQRSFDSTKSHVSLPTSTRDSKSSYLKGDQWSSSSIRSETDSEISYGSTAPPPSEESYTSYDASSSTEIWQKISPKNTGSKSPLSRAVQVQNRVPGGIKKTDSGLISLPPVRRSSREDISWKENVGGKAEEILGKPKVPLRNLKKQSKRSHVRSLGRKFPFIIFISFILFLF